MPEGLGVVMVMFSPIPIPIPIHILIPMFVSHLVLSSISGVESGVLFHCLIGLGGLGAA